MNSFRLMISNAVKPAVLLSAAWLLLVPSAATGALLYVGAGAPTESTGNIYAFTPAGSSFTFASGLNGPYGLAFDASGNLYESDLGTSTIYRFTPGGIQSTFATVGPDPLGLAFDASGNLFVACWNGIYEITPSGGVSVFAKLSPGVFSNGGLAFDANGNLFVANLNDGVFKYAPDGTVTTFAFLVQDGPDALAFDASGNLFVSGFATGNIYKYAPNGSRSTFASGLVDPEDLAFDASGNLYEMDNGSGNIYEFTHTGRRSTFASGFSTGLSGLHALAFARVPEPATWLLTAIGICGVWLAHLRRRAVLAAVQN
jgi:DNA-binding beta-propeller fold protein YncE